MPEGTLEENARVVEHARGEGPLQARDIHRAVWAFCGVRDLHGKVQPALPKENLSASRPPESRGDASFQSRDDTVE